MDIDAQRTELYALHAKLCSEAFDVMKRKNHDYSAGDPLSNFFLSEALGTCTAANGIINRLGDKLSRLVSVLGKGEAQVKDESVDDTIVDIINYAVLLRAVTLRK